MRRLTILVSVLLSGGFYVACSAFGGSDSTGPSSPTDSGAGKDSAIDVALDGGTQLTDGGGISADAGGNDKDSGVVSGCKTLFDLPNCQNTPASFLDAGSAGTNLSHPTTGTFPSCSQAANATGSSYFSGSFNANITGATSIEFAIDPITIPNVAVLGCLLRVQVGNEYTEVSLRVVSNAQQVAHHIVRPTMGTDSTNGLALPRTLPGNGWSAVRLDLVPDGGMSTVSVNDGNGAATLGYGPYNVPTGSGTISYTCGVVAPESDTTVLIEGVKIITCN